MKEELRKLVAQAVRDLYKDANEAVSIEHPQHVEFGDYSTNVAMKLAKTLHQHPKKIADEIVAKISTMQHAGVEKVTAVAPGFVNFYLPHAWLQSQMSEVIKKLSGTELVLSTIGGGKLLLLEYSAPNIAKPMSAGHLRNTVFGDSLKRIYRAVGYRVETDNHIGDWGTQFGILIYAYKRFGDRTKVEKNPIDELYKLYVDFNKLMAENPSLKSKGKEEFVKLEKGDKENRELWQWFKEVSMREFHDIYGLLGIEKFDHEYGESFYEDKMQRDIQELMEKKIAVQGEDSSIYVDLEAYNLGRFIVVKSDGATTYGARDISTYRYREEHIDFAKQVYVVGSAQYHYFKQLFKVLELMGFKKVAQTIHVPYGWVLGANGEKMSTRDGTIIAAREAAARSVEKALQIINEKNPKLEHKDAVARMIGIGALKYLNLYKNRNTAISFNWDEMLSFDGNTGPYLQYTHARIRGLIRKAQDDHGITVDSMSDTGVVSLDDPREGAILKQLYRFDEVCELASQDAAPNYIADYIYLMASLFNDFYSNVPVLQAEVELRIARLRLAHSVSLVIKKGLYLLGIEAPDRM